MTTITVWLLSISMSGYVGTSHLAPFMFPTAQDCAQVLKNLSYDANAGKCIQTTVLVPK
jgi:hypothetical protein